MKVIISGKKGLSLGCSAQHLVINCFQAASHSLGISGRNYNNNMIRVSKEGREGGKREGERRDREKREER